MFKMTALEKRLYYSTNLVSPAVPFSEALLKGLAPDGGLYMPVELPSLGRQQLAAFSGMQYHEVAFSVLDTLIGEDIGSDALARICRDAYYFDSPVEKVAEGKYIMRLDRGPTASFKDFAARMMSRLMQHYLALSGKHLTILTATSGDTGSAVASAFYGMGNIDVIILYPENEVTAMQRKQMTTLRDNIRVIALNGKFDDCQRLVKQAFTDPELASYPLSSANSINIGRLLPQSVYYIYGWSRVDEDAGEKVIFSVPSGNFGNLMGGLIAKELGLPVERFILSTNSNDEVPEFLRSGVYRQISPSLNCISSAMNVGHPSNLSRIVALYGGVMNEKGLISRQPDMNRMREDLYGISVSDEETRAVIARVYEEYGVLLEPHGAVAWKGIEEYLDDKEQKGKGQKTCISLETAHPAKFPGELRKIIGKDPPLPESLEGLDSKAEEYTKLENNYGALREFILENLKK